MNELRFAAPWLLLALPAAVAAAWWLGRRRRRSDARLRLPQATLRARIAVSPWARLDALVPWLRGAALLLLVLALARPQSGATVENVTTYGVDIVVVLDVSSSMRAADFDPSRLAAAKHTVRRFIEGRGADRIGLVAFAGLAATRCPLTLDHDMLTQLLEEVDFAPREQDGTAIGMGLATALNRLRDSDAKSRVVVLLTDGINNAGQIGPAAAAEAARALGVRVYTIGVGSDDEVPMPFGPGGVRYQLHRVELDEELLQSIAETTDGVYFRVADADTLERVFEQIDELETSEIESTERIIYDELFHIALLPAVVLLLLERLLVSTRLRRIP